jgi:hypothetical protein
MATELELKPRVLQGEAQDELRKSSSSLLSSSSSFSSVASLPLTAEPSTAEGGSVDVLTPLSAACRESVSAVFSFDAEAGSRRTSVASTDTARSSPANSGDRDRLPASYSVPSTSALAHTPRGWPAVDVIATYMNTTDRRTVKTELMRAHAHFSSFRGLPPSRARATSREASGEWGWFADIDSSGESWGGDGSVHSLRRRLSADLGIIDVADAVHVLGDEQTNTRLTAAHKTFSVATDDGKSKVVAGTISIPKFRIVQSRAGADRHAQYLVTFQMGKDLFADWRRYSEFGELAKQLPAEAFPRSQAAWRAVDTRWFNRLEPSYLHQKCVSLENFMREIMYESSEPARLVDFLGGFMGRVNARPTDPVDFRPAAQLPKELRPPQPPHERQLFEKVWAENFKRSRVDYGTLAPKDQ